MGMYDTIVKYMDCPYCGTRKVFEGQTKDLDSGFETYHTLDVSKKGKPALQLFIRNTYVENSKIPAEFGKLKYVDVTFNCGSVSCQFDADREWIDIQKIPSGFGRSFDGKIKIDQVGKDYHLVGDLYDVVLDGHDEKHFSNYKSKWTAKQKKAFDKFVKEQCKGQEVIACRYFGKFKGLGK